MRADQTDRAEDVDIELGTRLLERHILDRTIRAVASVVDQHVDASGHGNDAVDASLHRSVVGHVQGQDIDSGLCKITHPIHASRGRIHGVAEAFEFEGGSGADAGRRAGYESNFGVHGWSPG
jgi:hypothetical protein